MELGSFDSQFGQTVAGGDAAAGVDGLGKDKGSRYTFFHHRHLFLDVAARSGNAFVECFKDFPHVARLHILDAEIEEGIGCVVTQGRQLYLREIFGVHLRFHLAGFLNLDLRGTDVHVVPSRQGEATVEG